MPNLKSLIQGLLELQYETVLPLKKKKSEYILGKRFQDQLLNTEKSLYNFYQILSILNSIQQKKGTILFVCDHTRNGILLKNLAQTNGHPYIIQNWVPGFISNFEEVFTSMIKTLKKIEKKKTFSYKKQKMFYRLFKGVNTLNKLPDLLFVVDTFKCEKIIKEANTRNIPVIMFSGLNSISAGVQYPAITNVFSKKNILLYLKILNIILKKKWKK